MVRLGGDIDLATAEHVAEALDAAGERADLVMVDVTAVRSLDRSVFHTILDARRRLLRKGTSLVLVVDGPETPRIFQIRGLDVLPAGAVEAREVIGNSA